ncbi:MAG TPA: arsenate reductase ArsC [Anaerolineae bacterium]|nr:arsenate reductase ArsC [Anaerolineae bacterium]
MQVGNPKLTILFLCTGNSARSQMAEGWARHSKGDMIEPYSAGVEAHGLNPYAVRVMKEAGVDISGQRSKLVEAVMGIEFDYVITLCGHANENCPLFPGRTRVIHVGFEDPAKAHGTEEEVMAAFRRVRDDIQAFVQSLPGFLQRAGSTNELPQKHLSP